MIRVLYIIRVKSGWSKNTKNISRKIPYYKSLQVTRPFYLRTSPVNTHSHTYKLFAGNRVEKIELLIWFYHEKRYMYIVYILYRFPSIIHYIYIYIYIWIVIFIFRSKVIRFLIWRFCKTNEIKTKKLRGSSYNINNSLAANILPEIAIVRLKIFHFSSVTHVGSMTRRFA